MSGVVVNSGGEETGSCSSSSAVTIRAEPAAGGADPLPIKSAAELAKDELKRASTSLPPLYYDDKVGIGVDAEARAKKALLAFLYRFSFV